MKKTLVIILVMSTFGLIACEDREDNYEHHRPHPYHFGYEVKDKYGSHYRKEEGDGHGQMKGSYGYTDEKGIYREVHYIADKAGFRAEIKTNEPGTANQDPSDVKLHAKPAEKNYAHGSHGYNEHEQNHAFSHHRRSDEYHSFRHRQGEHGGHE